MEEEAHGELCKRFFRWENIVEFVSFMKTQDPSFCMGSGGTEFPRIFLRAVVIRFRELRTMATTFTRDLQYGRNNHLFLLKLFLRSVVCPI